MNQISHNQSFREHPPMPTEGTQARTLLEGLLAGERLTVRDAMDRYRVYALSQRMGELRRDGWPVQSEMIKLSSGKRVAQYWIE